MRVTTWTLEMREPPTAPATDPPPGTCFVHATGMTPEFARWLYAVVGGPWFWVDRLRWGRDQWVAELRDEFHVAYEGGVPIGYVQLHPESPGPGASEVEVRYFGLVDQAACRGLGRALLEHGVHAAWTLHERAGIPQPTRVWVHTCSLDGPAALANYQARGFALIHTEETDEELPEETPGAWRAAGGPA